MRTRPTPLKNVSVTIDGKTYEGTYYVQVSMVYVQSLFGSKAMQAGRVPPEAVAKLLLSELVRGAQKA
jgi:hypothetical protein